MSTNEKEIKEKISSSDSSGLGSIEGPKYSCALGGAYGTALGVYGLVPLLHSGLGCGLGQLFGQLYAGGQNAGGGSRWGNKYANNRTCRRTRYIWW